MRVSLLLADVGFTGFGECARLCKRLREARSLFSDAVVFTVLHSVDGWRKDGRNEGRCDCDREMGVVMASMIRFLE